MLKRFIIIFFILLLIFLFLTKRGAGAQNVVVSQTSPEGAVLLLNLPKVYVLPDSPFYFLVLLWEQMRLFLVSTPEERSALFLSLAEEKMAGVVRMQEAGSKEAGDQEGQVLGLIRNYQRYLIEAYKFFNLVQDSPKREQLYWELEKQTKNLELFRGFLEKTKIQVDWEIPL